MISTLAFIIQDIVAVYNTKQAKQNKQKHTHTQTDSQKAVNQQARFASQPELLVIFHLLFL